MNVAKTVGTSCLFEVTFEPFHADPWLVQLEVPYCTHLWCLKSVASSSTCCPSKARGSVVVLSVFLVCVRVFSLFFSDA